MFKLCRAFHFELEEVIVCVDQKVYNEQLSQNSQKHTVNVYKVELKLDPLKGWNKPIF